MNRRLLVALVCMSAPAAAWDSRLEEDGVEGPRAAQVRWILDGKDEHRIIWRKTLELAGAPANADADFVLHTYTIGSTDYEPEPFLSATYVQDKIHSPSEFAQLPDFSYSLWDWALGNDTCPIDRQLGAQACHAFAGHMGATNSSHFVPQTSTNYNWYHQLAMDKAAVCDVVRTRIGARSDLQPYLKDCVAEALVLEAVGHHFLQDSWSMGHMWERWGSPNYTDFTSRFGGAAFPTAMAVAMLSGLIHGARPVLQPHFPPGSDVDDAMNAPFPEVAFKSQSGVVNAVGDLYLGQLLNGGFPGQFDQLFSCAVGGVRAVLQAAGEPLDAPQVSPVDPSTHDLQCFGARATNEALAKGFAVDYTTAGGTQVVVPLEVIIPGLQVAGGAVGALPLQIDLLRIAALLRVTAAADPQGTTMAEGGMGQLLGVDVNSAFNVVPAYADPSLPWPGTATAQDAPALALARQFHSAHAKDWCERFADGDPQLDVNKLRDRVKTAPPQEVDAACAVCRDFASRHLRVGDVNTYVPDPAKEPLCGLIADPSATVQYVYQGDNRGNVSRDEHVNDFCGCAGPLQAAAGTFRNQASGAIGTSLLVRLRDPGGAAPAADKALTVTGPAGWNANQPLALTYPAGLLRQFYTTAVAPVTGAYTVTSGSLSVQVNLDAGSILAAPANVAADLSSPGAIGSSWDSVIGAGSYLTRVFDITRGAIRTPTAFVGAPGANLPVKLNAADQNALQVFAFSNDMTPSDPAIPPRFDVSFNRIILAPSIKISPASATVGIGGTQGLTAAVTGLASTALTWTVNGGTLAPSGLSAIWTAPDQPATYTVTATSDANPVFRAFSTLKVNVLPGGPPCDVTKVGPLFAGQWQILGSIGIEGTNSCDGGDFYDYRQNGTLTMSAVAGTTSGEIDPGPFHAWQGTFSCAFDDNGHVVYTFSSVDPVQGTRANLRLGDGVDPENVNLLSGELDLELAQQGRFHVIGCPMEFEASR